MAGAALGGATGARRKRRELLGDATLGLPVGGFRLCFSRRDWDFTGPAASDRSVSMPRISGHYQENDIFMDYP